jgi:alkylhydroperoxidase family enzyme
MVDNGLIGPTGLMDLRNLAPRLRELVLLRTCVANRCHYEFNLHVQTISERMGLTPALIDDIRQTAPNAVDWSAAELAAIRLVDALVSRREVSDEEFDAARMHFDEATLIEITHLVGLYTGVAMMVALAKPNFDRYRSQEPVLAQPKLER